MKEKIPITFDQATLKAASYIRRKEKLLRLLEIATGKSQRYYESLLASWESLQIFLRMIRAWVSGKYCAPADTVLVIVAAIIYFLNPFDLIPDSVPVFGLVDDAAVIGCVATAKLKAINNFRKWEILFGGDFPFPAAEPLPAKIDEVVGNIVQAVGHERFGPRLRKTE
ncbi:MAG: hypothetical protein JWO71_4677 [Candidatus Acidoferrum typicum]|nr:hypothetical protein [Candidatus Acidoferrum typicum]